MAIDPLTLALIGTSISTVAAGTSAAFSMIQAGQQKKVGQKTARDIEAARRKNRGLEEEDLRDRLSRIKANTAASGIVFDGSPLAVFEETVNRFRTRQSIDDFESATAQGRAINQGNIIAGDLYGRGIGTAIGGIGSGLTNAGFIFDGAE